MTSTRILLASVSLIAIAGAAAPAGAADFTPVPSPVAKVEGTASANALAAGLIEVPVAVGTMPVENVSGAFPFYGFAGDGSMIPAYGAVQQKDVLIEATKTEPDKNTYLVLTGATGPTAGYDYGTHFLFQGHENGPKDADGNSLGHLTRINLDADEAHRVTLLAEKDVNDAPIPIDRRLRLGSVRQTPAPHRGARRARRRLAGDRRIPLQGRAAARNPGPGWLRGRPGHARRLRLARRG